MPRTSLPPPSLRKAAGARPPPPPAAGEEPPASEGELALGVLPQLVGRQLRIAQLLAFKDFATEVDGTSLTPGSFEILELLACNPGLGQSRLANAIGLDKSTLVPAIARLMDLGLVERRPSEVDKRANELRITAKGLQALAGLRAYVLERDAHITRDLSAAEAATLNLLLKKVAASCGR